MMGVAPDSNWGQNQCTLSIYPPTTQQLICTEVFNHSRKILRSVLKCSSTAAVLVHLLFEIFGLNTHQPSFWHCHNKCSLVDIKDLGKVVEDPGSEMQ